METSKDPVSVEKNRLKMRLGGGGKVRARQAPKSGGTAACAGDRGPTWPTEPILPPWVQSPRGGVVAVVCLFLLGDVFLLGTEILQNGVVALWKLVE